MRKNIILCLIICLCICFLPCTAYASSTADAKEPIDTSADCSLTLRYTHNGSAFADLVVQIYCVATVSSDFQFSLTDTFQKTDLTMNGIESIREWDAVRSTMESYIAANQITADKKAITDKDGVVAFDNLKAGMYFVMPVQHSANGVCYSFGSALISVPGLDENGLWLYNVIAAPKPNVYMPSGENKEYKLLKLWRDNNNSSKRPKAVEVDIICNGDVVDNVVLSEENHWSYSWTAADNGDVWKVIERNVPKGYVMTVEEQVASFTITNTSPDILEIPKTGDTSNIGLYVMLLCSSGLALIILGIVFKRKSKL